MNSSINTTATQTNDTASFSALGLSDAILKAVADKGYTTPSAIQQEAVPAVISGRDLMAAAQTGTGKTAGFTLPILQRLSTQPPTAHGKKGNQIRTLIVTPTRELAAQIGESVQDYGKYLSVSSAVVFGGVKINPQMRQLRGGKDILVATPGRLLDLYQQNAIKFDALEMLVLDEADRMLDMGFIHDIRRILKLLPAKRQNLLFSATFSDDIRKLAKGMINDPLEISVTPRNATAKSVDQCLYPVDKKQKPALLNHLIWEEKWEQVLVFSRTKHGANKLAKYLESQGVSAAAIHGNKSQGARTRALKEFKDGTVRALVATDIAARGIDIDQLPNVVNYDLPNVPEDYVHRIGRTGRAGANGQAVSLVTAEEVKQLADIERLTKQLIERRTMPGFEPSEAVPQTTLNSRPARNRKPAAQARNTGFNGKSSANGKPGGNSQRPQRRRNSERRPAQAAQMSA